MALAEKIEHGKIVNLFCNGKGRMRYKRSQKKLHHRVKKYDKEVVYTFYSDGRYYSDVKDPNKDLVLVKREFEDGDIIHFLYDDDETAILKKCEGEYTYIYFCYNDRNWTIGYNKRIVGDFRIATEEEKQTLFDALAKNGKLWNPETKQIEIFQISIKKREESISC
jgi:hypothetical protein